MLNDSVFQVVCQGLQLALRTKASWGTSANTIILTRNKPLTKISGVNQMIYGSVQN